MKQISDLVSGKNSMRLMRAGLVALALGSLSATAVYAQEGEGHWGMHHGQGMDGDHGQKMIERLAPDATPEQKAKLTAIHKAAFADLKPLHEKRRAAHQDIAKILSQPTIDRAALEKARQAEMQIADQVSKRMMQARADAAEVLTPAQRAKAAERMQQHEEKMKEHMKERMQKHNGAH